ncbi:MAG: GTPase HflX [Chroococcopsis gigantea SAG 12.99]|nr:GTPase HflX [Chroococcopsis gigantea SAG 12.99]
MIRELKYKDVPLSPVTPIDTIYGNTQGLKANQMKQLQRLYNERLPIDTLTTPEFAQRLAGISTEIHQPLCAYINRRGQIIRVGIGTPRQTQIPLLELPRYGVERLCGIRCIATELKPEAPKEASLTAMALQRLDALVTLNLTGSGMIRRGGGATGYIEDVYLAHLVPGDEDNHESKWTVSPPLSLESLSKQDFLSLVEGLETEFQKEFRARQVDTKSDRVLIVGLMTEDNKAQQFEDGLTELTRLVDTAGGEVLEITRQKRSHPHPQTVIGSGKVEEIALLVQTLGANLVVFNRDLSPAQIRNLETGMGVRVVDRTEVILDIFAQRAQSGAGKLQVELAQLEYMLPRLSGRGLAMSRLGGGIGTRGPGETKLETEKRTIGKRLSRLQQEVNQLQAHRSRLRKQRQKQDVASVAIVGYTNAGKSTLINALTSAGVYTADQLFATLDPTTRRLTVEDKTLLLTDTVGFIHELPPSLVDAFRATLEEVTEADALLHVVDLSHPAWSSQITSVNAILEEMPIQTGPMLMAFNKIDRADTEVLEQAKIDYPNAVFISASRRVGMETLKHKLLNLINY